MEQSGQMTQIHGVDMYDIYDLAYTPWWQEAWFIVATSIALLILVFGVVYFWKYRKKYKKLSYQEQLFLQLEQLKNMPAEQAQNFYIILTNVLKEYLTQMYGIPAKGLTDDELLAQLSTMKALPEAMVMHVRKILEGIVIVKFAQGQDLKETLQEALTSMYEIVKQKKQD